MNASRSLAGVACLFLVETNAAQLPAQGQDTTQRQVPPSLPLLLTLQGALDRARKNLTQLQSALTTAAVARGHRTQGRDTLLPSVTYNNSAIYTQGIGSGGQASGGTTPVFIANSAALV
jgi:hypothetical protein